MVGQEIEDLLNRFGFTRTLNQSFGGARNLRHVIHYETNVERLVEYYIDDTLGTVKALWAFTKDDLSCLENIPDLEIWLKMD